MMFVYNPIIFRQENADVKDPCLFIYYPFNESMFSDVPGIGEIIPINESSAHFIPIYDDLISTRFTLKNEGSIARGFNPTHKGHVNGRIIPHHGDFDSMGFIVDRGVAGSALDLENKKGVEGVSHQGLQNLQSELIQVLVSLYITIHQCLVSPYCGPITMSLYHVYPYLYHQR
jgi:hypothetical protein